MNKVRRKALAALYEGLSKVQFAVQDIKDELNTLKGEEEEYKENMPESLQDGDKGEKAQSAIDAMQEAFDKLEEIDSSLDEAMTSIETAGE